MYKTPTTCKGGTPSIDSSASRYTPERGLYTPVKCQTSLYYNSQQKLRSLAGNAKHLYSSPCANMPANMSAPMKTTPGTGCGSARKNNWPSGMRSQGPRHYYNPFEAGLLDNLDGPLFSPNVFKTSTPDNGGAARFQWSIDEMALLKPVEIDDPPHPDTWIMDQNSELEEKAQQAIDTYFSSNVIVPSPWTDSAKKKSFKLPTTPGSVCLEDSPMIFSSKTAERTRSSPSKSKNVPSATESRNPANSKKEATTQTVLSLPLDFDLQAMLGNQFYTQERSSSECRRGPENLDVEDDESNQDGLCNSSLRRKLFFHGGAGNPISPVKKEKTCKNLRWENESSPSPQLSPVAKEKISDNAAALESSPNLDQFSSSPIKSLHMTPTFRRCSTAPQLMESPEMSPIGSVRHTETPGSFTAIVSSPDNMNCTTPLVHGISSFTVTPQTACSTVSQTQKIFSSSRLHKDVKTTDGRRCLALIDDDDVYCDALAESFESLDEMPDSDSESRDYHIFIHGARQESTRGAPSPCGTTDTGYQSNIMQTMSMSGNSANLPDSVIPSISADFANLDGSGLLPEPHILNCDESARMSTGSVLVDDATRHHRNALVRPREFSGLIFLSESNVSDMEWHGVSHQSAIHKHPKQIGDVRRHSQPESPDPFPGHLSPIKSIFGQNLLRKDDLGRRLSRSQPDINHFDLDLSSI